eukprot:jgi/Mesvir1/5849/Mv00641-RA.1
MPTSTDINGYPPTKGNKPRMAPVPPHSPQRVPMWGPPAGAPDPNSWHRGSKQGTPRGDNGTQPGGKPDDSNLDISPWSQPSFEEDWLDLSLAEPALRRENITPVIPDALTQQAINELDENDAGDAASPAGAAGKEQAQLAQVAADRVAAACERAAGALVDVVGPSATPSSKEDMLPSKLAQDKLAMLRALESQHQQLQLQQPADDAADDDSASTSTVPPYGGPLVPDKVHALADAVEREAELPGSSAAPRTPSTTSRSSQDLSDQMPPTKQAAHPGGAASHRRGSLDGTTTHRGLTPRRLGEFQGGAGHPARAVDAASRQSMAAGPGTAGSSSSYSGGGGGGGANAFVPSLSLATSLAAASAALRDCHGYIVPPRPGTAAMGVSHSPATSGFVTARTPTPQTIGAGLDLSGLQRALDIPHQLGRVRRRESVPGPSSSSSATAKGAGTLGGFPSATSAATGTSLSAAMVQGLRTSPRTPPRTPKDAHPHSVFVPPWLSGSLSTHEGDRLGDHEGGAGGRVSPTPPAQRSPPQRPLLSPRWDPLVSKDLNNAGTAGVGANGVSGMGSGMVGGPGAANPGVPAGATGGASSWFAKPSRARDLPRNKSPGAATRRLERLWQDMLLPDPAAHPGRDAVHMVEEWLAAVEGRLLGPARAAAAAASAEDASSGSGSGGGGAAADGGEGGRPAGGEGTETAAGGGGTGGSSGGGSSGGVRVGAGGPVPPLKLPLGNSGGGGVHPGRLLKDLGGQPGGGKPVKEHEVPGKASSKAEGKSSTKAGGGSTGGTATVTAAAPNSSSVGLTHGPSDGHATQATMLANVTQHAQLAGTLSSVYALAFLEVTRQVAAHCRERGALLVYLWEAHCRLCSLVLMLADVKREAQAAAADRRQNKLSRDLAVARRSSELWRARVLEVESEKAELQQAADRELRLAAATGGARGRKQGGLGGGKGNPDPVDVVSEFLNILRQADEGEDAREKQGVGRGGQIEDGHEEAVKDESVSKGVGTVGGGDGGEAGGEVAEGHEQPLSAPGVPGEGEREGQGREGKGGGDALASKEGSAVTKDDAVATTHGDREARKGDSDVNAAKGDTTAADKDDKSGAAAAPGQGGVGAGSKPRAPSFRDAAKKAQAVVHVSRFGREEQARALEAARHALDENKGLVERLAESKRGEALWREQALAMERMLEEVAHHETLAGSAGHHEPPESTPPGPTRVELLVEVAQLKEKMVAMEARIAEYENQLLFPGVKGARALARAQEEVLENLLLRKSGGGGSVNSSIHSHIGGGEETAAAGDSNDGSGGGGKGGRWKAAARKTKAAMMLLPSPSKSLQVQSLFQSMWMWPPKCVHGQPVTPLMSADDALALISEVWDGLMRQHDEDDNVRRGRGSFANIVYEHLLARCGSPTRADILLARFLGALQALPRVVFRVELFKRFLGLPTGLVDEREFDIYFRLFYKCHSVSTAILPSDKGHWTVPFNFSQHGGLLFDDNDLLRQIGRVGMNAVLKEVEPFKEEIPCKKELRRFSSTGTIVKLDFDRVMTSILSALRNGLLHTNLFRTVDLEGEGRLRWPLFRRMVTLVDPELTAADALSMFRETIVLSRYANMVAGFASAPGVIASATAATTSSGGPAVSPGEAPGGAGMKGSPGGSAVAGQPGMVWSASTDPDTMLAPAFGIVAHQHGMRVAPAGVFELLRDLVRAMSLEGGGHEVSSDATVQEGWEIRSLAYEHFLVAVRDPQDALSKMGDLRVWLAANELLPVMVDRISAYAEKADKGRAVLEQRT